MRPQAAVLDAGVPGRTVSEAGTAPHRVALPPPGPYPREQTRSVLWVASLAVKVADVLRPAS
jgi:hypothetical protein